MGRLRGGHKALGWAFIDRMSPDDVWIYADEASLLPQAVIEFAIANFLELDSMPTDDRQSHTEDNNLLADLPTSLRAEIQQYATETEMPLEFVVELAIAHFLDPDSVTFDDCQVRVQRERVEHLKLRRDTRQATPALSQARSSGVDNHLLFFPGRPTGGPDAVQ